MKSLRMGLPLVDGSYMPFGEFENCKQLIDELMPDLRPPPRGLRIEAQTKDGKSVEIFIPYRAEDCAVAFIRDDPA